MATDDPYMLYVLKIKLVEAVWSKYVVENGNESR